MLVSWDYYSQWMVLTFTHSSLLAVYDARYIVEISLRCSILMTRWHSGTVEPHAARAGARAASWLWNMAHADDDLPIKMMIFYSYVKLPEGWRTNTSPSTALMRLPWAYL